MRSICIVNILSCTVWASVCLQAAEHVVRWKNNEVDGTEWAFHSGGLHSGSQTAAEAPKICVPDLRFQKSVGNKGVEMGFI